MTSSIEKAAQRLEQLRKAGAALPMDTVQPEVKPSSSSMPEPMQEASPVEKGNMDVHSSHFHSVPGSRNVQIDLAAMVAGGYVTPNSPPTATMDQFRVIKRPLLDNATGKGASLVKNGNLIMITSALSGEGKSFTAINLVMSLAMELNHTVLLVDADVTNPAVMKKLGLPPAPGLLDLLQDKSLKMSDVLLRTNVEKLTILPAGLPHPRAAELLASDGMTALLEDMGKRYSDRIIIFDSPPLLLTTEARALATHMGQIVIVVQAEKTLQSQVMSALSTIEDCPVKFMVLNQARVQALDNYGYGYGYEQALSEKRRFTAAI